MKRIGLLVPLAALLMIAGCASRAEIKTMQAQLEFIERSSGQMQERLVQLDSVYRVTVDKNVQYQADLKTALADLLDKSSAIDGRLSDMERRLNQIADQGIRVPVTPSQSRDTSAAADTSGQALPQVDQNKLFNDAFSDLKAAKYDLAIMEFNEFLSMFPDSPLADDAQYWLGECYYGKKDYAKAIPEFEKVEKNYPNGDKVVTALFKLGRSYEENGDKRKAKVIFVRLTKEFPNSFEAKPAQDRLKGL